jgi:Methyltransferase FkbM domain
MELDLRSQSQVFLGLAEVETHSWIRRCGSRAQTVIDVGAGYGELVLYFLKRTKARRVYAFEPLEWSRKRLRDNLILNGIVEDSRILISDNFVASLDDTAFCKLDSLLPEIESPAFVKVDVDGAEIDVLNGSSRLVDSRVACWLVETHSSDLEIACLELFRAAGYKTQVISNGWYRKVVPESRPIAHNRWFTAEPLDGPNH